MTQRILLVRCIGMRITAWWYSLTMARRVVTLTTLLVSASWRVTGRWRVCISMVHHRVLLWQMSTSGCTKTKWASPFVLSLHWSSMKQTTLRFIRQVSSLSTRTASRSITFLVTNELLQGLEQACSITSMDS